MNRRHAESNLWVAAIVLVAVTGLTVGRLQVVGNGLDRVWNEDGRVFLAGAVRHGVLSIFYVYAGYLHVVPRLLALASRLLPLQAYAVYSVVVSSIVVGLLAAFIYVAAAVLTASRAWALLPALALALAPALAVESLGCLTNLQWFLLAAAFWAVLLPPDRSPGLRFAATTVAGLAALSSFLAVLLVPAALVWHRRSVLKQLPVRALLAGLAFQLVAIAWFPHTPGGGTRHPSVYAGLLRGFAEMLGPAVRPAGHTRAWDLILGIAFGLLLVACRLAIRRPSRAVAIAWVTAVVVYLIPSIITGRAPARYEACASLFVVAGVSFLGPRLDWRLAALPLAILVVYAVNRFPVFENRVSGPTWTNAVQHFRATCRESGVRAGALRVAPQGVVLVTLSCRVA